MSSTSQASISWIEERCSYYKKHAQSTDRNMSKVLRAQLKGREEIFTAIKAAMNNPHITLNSSQQCSVEKYVEAIQSKTGTQDWWAAVLVATTFIHSCG